MKRNEDGQDICHASRRATSSSLHYPGTYKNTRLKGKRRLSREYPDKSLCVYSTLKEYFKEDENKDYRKSSALFVSYKTFIPVTNNKRVKPIFFTFKILLSWMISLKILVVEK